MRSSGGNLWFGWGVFCGIPGTLIAFGIAWPLGLLVLIATIAALTIGARVEKTNDALDGIERDAAERGRRDRVQ